MELLLYFIAVGTLDGQIAANCPRSLPGLEFESEHELVMLIERQFGLSVGGSWKWVREFATSSGLADLIAVELAHDWRLRIRLGNIVPRWAYALHCIPGVLPFTLTSFSSLANVSISTARTILRRFEDAGFCKSVVDGVHWIKTIEPEPLALRIVAVEAKLRDWRRALYQAAQHADYATHCWVVLDRGALNNARAHSHEFRMRGVGLAGLSGNGNAQVVVPAPARVPRIPHRLWQANAEIARRLA